MVQTVKCTKCGTEKDYQPKNDTTPNRIRVRCKQCKKATTHELVQSVQIDKNKVQKKGTSGTKKPKKPISPGPNHMEKEKTKQNKKLEIVPEIPDFNQILQFCESHAIIEDDIIKEFDDYEIEQFYKHVIPRSLYKKRYQEDRGGGGWSGAAKCLLNILLKMKKEVN